MTTNNMTSLLSASTSRFQHTTPRTEAENRPVCSTPTFTFDTKYIMNTWITFDILSQQGTQHVHDRSVQAAVALEEPRRSQVWVI